ncbi:MAG: hypothetical protein M1829_004174 [Trizodia sp. TS-e1964]|nr:MAG: hypothetical protein M1829_004174 [Trizodia sp. TS-e1964]
MNPYLVHQCQVCASGTIIAYSTYAFSQNLQCTNCGAMSVGISPQIGEQKMQDDLSTLFSRNLTLANIPIYQPEAMPAEESAPIEKPITYSISQHYHHSAHLAAPQPTPPSQTEARKSPTDPSAAEIILSRHGVDYSQLLPSQIVLFQHADTTQKMRLVELWRISPSNGSDQPYAEESNKYMDTQDDAQMSPQSLSDSDEMLDIHDNETRDAAEPYILSGYESLAQREYEALLRADTNRKGFTKGNYSPLGSAVGHDQYDSDHGYNRSTDPVYQRPAPHQHRVASWPDLEWYKSAGQQGLVHQYGALDQFKEINHSMVATGRAPGQSEQEDEEML